MTDFLEELKDDPFLMVITIFIVLFGLYLTAQVVRWLV